MQVHKTGALPSKRWRKEWETRLRKTHRDTWISDKPAGMLSLAVNPEEGLVLPIQVYLLEGALRIGEPWRTTEKHGYHVCIWYDYLRYKGIGIFEATEINLRNFLLGGGVRYSNVSSISRKLEPAWTPTTDERFQAIVAFYDFWEEKRGKRLKHFRGGTIATLDSTLFKRASRSSRRAKINFSRPALEKARNQKGTPSAEDADRILDRALEGEDENRAQTYYLVGSLARRSGSRAVGIGSLTVPELLKGLMNEPRFRAISDYKKVFRHHQLPENRRILVANLQQMKAERRTFIFCDVRNKGGGEPIPIAIPIDLCVEILDYIWTCRADLIRKRFDPKGLEAPPNVFLSYKTRAAGGALQPESFGNFYGEIFRELEIDGSLHRFRATFCQEVIRDLYIRERAINGMSWQQNNILEYARKLLGHKNPHSLEHYLSNVLAEELMSGDPIIVTSPEDTPFVRAICAKLSGPDGDPFRLKLREFCETEEIAPITEEGRRYALF